MRPFAAKTTSGLETARRSPPRAGPRNVPMLSIVLEATLAAVSSFGVRTSDGQQRGLRRAEDRPRDGRRRDEHVDDGGRPAGGDHRRGAEHHSEPDRVARHHHRDPREPVGERRRERGGDGRGDHADQADEPDRRRAALAVGVDPERDEVRPAAEHRAGPGELEAPERRAREDVAAARARRCAPCSPTRVPPQASCCATRSEMREDFSAVVRRVGKWPMPGPSVERSNEMSDEPERFAGSGRGRAGRRGVRRRLRGSSARWRGRSLRQHG